MASTRTKREPAPQSLETLGIAIRETARKATDEWLRDLGDGEAVAPDLWDHVIKACLPHMKGYPAYINRHAYIKNAVRNRVKATVVALHYGFFPNTHDERAHLLRARWVIAREWDSRDQPGDAKRYADLYHNRADYGMTTAKKITVKAEQDERIAERLDRIAAKAPVG